ncbi:N-acetylmuramoyl-L-alanine amidase [Bacillus sp. OV322]|uniref:cell wall hydrolase n=1 Tax=Bacillus sp. OV322 TaxID=1882764 RepID=UPI0008E4DFA1|nr:cell wall hydrolase [Bacillus sp. OV322]SFD02587.1 N-acetylmuramoyl-L-alanine amidase [Bacillus sp. OV322]
MKLVKLLITAFTFVLCISYTLNSADASQLVKGSRGHHVLQLQKELKYLGYFHSAPTGYYGTITASAVKSFQQDFRIEAVGFVGPRTARKLADINMAAHTVYGEARGESYKGQVAVAAVILNRVHSRKFPNTLHGVIHQKNAFSAVQDGQYTLQPDSTAYRAVKAAYRGWDPTYGSLYYYNPRITTSKWIYTRPITYKLGHHQFAR